MKIRLPFYFLMLMALVVGSLFVTPVKAQYRLDGHNLTQKDFDHLDAKFDELRQDIKDLTQALKDSGTIKSTTSETSYTSASEEEPVEDESEKLPTTASGWRLKAEDFLKQGCLECAEMALKKAQAMETTSVTTVYASNPMMIGSGKTIPVGTTTTTISSPDMISSYSEPVMYERRGLFGRRMVRVNGGSSFRTMRSSATSCASCGF